MENTNNTAGTALVIEGFFKNVDFSSLNGSIEALANSNHELNTDEKKMAVELIDTWERDVTKKIGVYEDNIRLFVQFFNASNTNNDYIWNQVPEEKKQELAAISNSTAVYNNILAAEEELSLLVDTRPDEPIQDMDLTEADRIIENRQYELELAKYNIQYGRILRKISLAKRQWMKELNACPVVKTAIANANKTIKNVSSMHDQCRQKGQLAKLNITISSQAIRESLKDLLTFSDNI